MIGDLFRIVSIIVIIVFVAISFFIIIQITESIGDIEGEDSITIKQAEDATNTILTLLPIAIIIIGVLGLLSFIPKTFQSQNPPSTNNNIIDDDDADDEWFDPPGDIPSPIKITTQGDYILYDTARKLDNAMHMTKKLRENGYKAKINPIGNVLHEDECKYEVYKSRWKKEDELERGKLQWNN